MRSDSYVYYRQNGKSVSIEIRYEFRQHSVYVDNKFHAFGDSHSEASEIVRDYVKDHGLTETKPKKARAKKKASQRLAANSDA